MCDRQNRIGTILRNHNVPQSLIEHILEQKDLDRIEELLVLMGSNAGNRRIEQLRIKFEKEYNIYSTDFNKLLNRLNIIGFRSISWDNNGNEIIIVGGGINKMKRKSMKKCKSKTKRKFKKNHKSKRKKSRKSRKSRKTKRRRR